MPQATTKTSPRSRRGARTVRRARPALQPATPDLALATLVGRAGSTFRVRIGENEQVAAVDPGVDPQLLAILLQRHARVLVDRATAAQRVIVGALQTTRVVEIDANNDVDVKVRRFAVSADEKVLMRLPAAFVQVMQQEIELYGRRVLSRARDVFKVLATMIKLN